MGFYRQSSITTVNPFTRITEDDWLEALEETMDYGFIDTADYASALVEKRIAQEIQNEKDYYI